MDCTCLSRDFSLIDSIEKVGKLILFSSSCAYGDFTTCYYKGVVVDLVRSIANHIVLTSTDATIKLDLKGNTRS